MCLFVLFVLGLEQISVTIAWQQVAFFVEVPDATTHELGEKMVY